MQVIQQQQQQQNPAAVTRLAVVIISNSGVCAFGSAFSVCGRRRDCIERTPLCFPPYILPSTFNGSIKPGGGEKEIISKSNVRKPSLNICLLSKPKLQAFKLLIKINATM